VGVEERRYWRAQEIRRDKSWSKQQEQDKMQKAALGQSEGSEGEREENGRDGGARKRTSSDRSDGMGGRSIMKGGLQWLWVGLAPHPCASGSRHAAGLKRWQSRGTVRALPDAVAALLDAMRVFMRPAVASILQLL
jgi:hypothetical protein